MGGRLGRMAKDSVTDNFLHIWPVKLALMARLLISSRDQFDGDLDSVLLMLVIAEKTLSLTGPTTDPSFDHFLRLSEPAGAPFSALNAHYLALHTGIPRETARRKIDRLIERGWVSRSARGDLAATCRARSELADLIGQSVSFINALDLAVNPRP